VLVAVVVEVEEAGTADLVVVEVDVDEWRPATPIEGPPQAARLTERIAAAATVPLREPNRIATILLIDALNWPTWLRRLAGVRRHWPTIVNELNVIGRISRGSMG
jgi:hypothetical protein